MKNECQRFACRPQLLACRLASILLLGPGLKLGITTIEGCRKDRQSTLSFLTGLARRIMSKPKIQGLPGRIHPQCRWMTWICGGAELGDETVWGWMRNE